MTKITRIIDKTLANFLIILMASLVLVVTWQVITRFIMQQPSSYTEELARFLLIWIGLLGASYALRTKAHLGIDLITHRINDVARKVVIITVHLLIILFTVFVMIIGGLYLVSLTLTLNQISAALGVKMGYIYLVIPLSGVLMVYYSVLSIFETSRATIVNDTD